MRVNEEQDARIGEHACLDVRLTALQSLAGRRAGAGLAALVEVLGDLGFSWRDVARTAGVSLPVLRQWCQGAPTSGGNAERVAMLVALCEVAGHDLRIDDAAGQLEAPLNPAAPVNGIDLVASDRFDLALRLLTCAGEAAEVILDEFDPDWRERYASDVEVFVAPEGLLGVRLN